MTRWDLSQELMLGWFNMKINQRNTPITRGRIKKPTIISFNAEKVFDNIQLSFIIKVLNKLQTELPQCDKDHI